MAMSLCIKLVVIASGDLSVSYLLRNKPTTLVLNDISNNPKQGMISPCRPPNKARSTHSDKHERSWARSRGSMALNANILLLPAGYRLGPASSSFYRLSSFDILDLFPIL